MLMTIRRRKNQLRYISLFITFAILVGGLVPTLLAQMVFAAEPTGFEISSATVSLNGVPIDEITEPIKQNANGRLQYTWTLDNDSPAIAGDTATVSLPEALNYGTDIISGNLVDVNSEVYGTWMVNPTTKKLVLTLGTLPSERSNVQGTVQLDLQFSVSTMVVDVPYLLTIPLSGEQQKTYIIQFEVPNSSSVQKSGIQNPTDPNALTWTVDINRNLQTVTTPVVTDQIDSLLSYKAGSLKVYELTVKSNNSVVASATPIDESNYSVLYDDLSKQFSVTFHDTINRAYRLVYDTSIDQTQIDTTKTSFTYTNHVSFNSAVDTATVTITRGQLIEKDGIADRLYNANKISWSIDVNQSLFPLVNAVVEDNIPAGLTLDSTTIKVYQMPGNVLVDSSNYTIEQTATQFKITLGDINQTYLVTYDTTINPASKNNNNTSISFMNNAKLYQGIGEPKINTTTKTVTIVKGPAIAKAGTVQIGYNDDKYITWTVDLNLSEIDLGTSIFTDVIGAGHKLDANSIKVYPLTIDHSKTTNNLTQGEELLASGNYTMTPVGLDPINEFNIEFTDSITQSYRIVYRTIILDKQTQNFTNNGYIGINDGTPNITATTRPTIANVYTKANTSVNYESKVLGWLISVNPTQQAIQNLIITDTLTPELMMTNAQIDALVVKKGETILVKDTDYTLTPTIISGKIKGFVVDFQDKGHVVNDALYTVVYSTTMDPDVLSNNGNLTYANTAQFTADGVSQTRTATPVINNTAKHNGSKSGVLFADNKKINWTIDTNYLSKKVDNFEVTDTMLGNQKLVSGSIEIRNYTLNSAGVISVGALVDPASAGFAIEEAADGSSFKVTYPVSITTPYRITYTTAFFGQSQTTYANTAVTNQNENYSASVAYVDGDKFVSKTGVRVGLTHIDWQITLNKSQSTITQLTLTDTLSEGLILVENSFTVKKRDGTLVDFNTLFTLQVLPRALITDPQVFKLISKKQIEETYTIDYRTNLILDEILENKVANNVSFEGAQIVDGVDQATQTITHTFVTGSGTGTGEVGSFKLIKIDENGQLLQGAQFEFYKADKLLGLLTTDSNGEVTVGRLKYANYRIKEISAPVGFQIINENTNFTINNTTEKLITVQNDQLRTLQIIKTEKDKPTQLLKNAVFEVKDTSGVLLHTITTDSTGQATVKLPYGTYKIKEKTAPAGYNKNLQEFSINIEKYDKMEDLLTPKLIYMITVENTKIIYPSVPPQEPPTPAPNPTPTPSDPIIIKTPTETPIDGEIKIPEGSTPEITVPPTNGTIEIDDDGKWTYTPDKDYTGKDQFTVVITHPNGDKEEIIIEIEVEEVPLSSGNLPVTGQGIPWFTTIIGILMIAIGAYLVFFRKRFQDRKKTIVSGKK